MEHLYTFMECSVFHKIQNPPSFGYSLMDGGCLVCNDSYHRTLQNAFSNKDFIPENESDAMYHSFFSLDPM
ncbi:hypothetical protein JTE90_005382 [Oedothorax gibbosus]|uniref:Uncharacterized protein n=1 Tax=Oedothorax gibbosus TaxID=931172 RepID=A0AAV6V814_9ARAC|nr:hypothetical protein JTE90_005382 [Oedothorax gibbosus]